MLLSASRYIWKISRQTRSGAASGGIDQQIKRNRRFVAVALGKTAHQVHQVGALDTEGAKIGDDLAKLGTLIFDGLLEGSEAGDGLFGRGGDTAAENVQLDLDAEKGLENPIVKVARDAATLCFDGPGAQVPQKKDVLKRRTDMRGNALEPG